jgi:hypothetical protein
MFAVSTSKVNSQINCPCCYSQHFVGAPGSLSQTLLLSACKFEQVSERQLKGHKAAPQSDHVPTKLQKYSPNRHTKTQSTIFVYFNTLYRASFIILYSDQPMHNYFTNYHAATCFDTIVSSSDSLQSIPCPVTPVFQMQLYAIQFTIKLFHTSFMPVLIL